MKFTNEVNGSELIYLSLSAEVIMSSAEWNVPVKAALESTEQARLEESDRPDDRGNGLIPYNNFNARLTLCNFCSLLVAGTRRLSDGHQEVKEEVDAERIPDSVDSLRLYFLLFRPLSFCVTSSISRTSRTPSLKSVCE